jgi:hypothetical protein
MVPRGARARAARALAARAWTARAWAARERPAGHTELRTRAAGGSAHREGDNGSDGTRVQHKHEAALG